MNKDKLGADWPGIDHPSDVDVWLTLIFGYAEPFLYVISGVVFIIGSLLLAVKTGAPGRFLILAGPVLLAVFGIVEAFRRPMFPTSYGLSLLEITVGRFVVALAVFVSIAGYGMLVWWLYRNGRVKQPG